MRRGDSRAGFGEDERQGWEHRRPGLVQWRESVAKRGGCTGKATVRRDEGYEMGRDTSQWNNRTMQSNKSDWARSTGRWTNGATK